MTETSARLRKPNLRAPEKHEVGYNTIVLPGVQSLSPDAVREAAALVKLNEQALRRILDERIALPVARTASREEAELVFERLNGLGFRVLTLRDEDSIKRVRTLSRDDTQLVFNPNHPRDEVEAPWSDIVLLVPARLIEKRVEVKEVKSRRAENEILDTSEFFSDEPVIDIYLSTHDDTWRVSATGFDFSCLGSEKTLIVNENIARLERWLVARATNAKLDDSYRRVRPLLDLVWPSEQETKSSGWRRERPGKLSLGVATINSNERQFTRYSRLLYHMTSQQPDEQR